MMTQLNQFIAVTEFVTNLHCVDLLLEGINLYEEIIFRQIKCNFRRINMLDKSSDNLNIENRPRG